MSPHMRPLQEEWPCPLNPALHFPLGTPSLYVEACTFINVTRRQDHFDPSTSGSFYGMSSQLASGVIVGRRLDGMKVSSTVFVGGGLSVQDCSNVTLANCTLLRAHLVGYDSWLGDAQSMWGIYNTTIATTADCDAKCSVVAVSTSALITWQSCHISDTQLYFSRSACVRGGLTLWNVRLERCFLQLVNIAALFKGVQADVYLQLSGANVTAIGCTLERTVNLLNRSSLDARNCSLLCALSTTGQLCTRQYCPTPSLSLVQCTIESGQDWDLSKGVLANFTFCTLNRTTIQTNGALLTFSRSLFDGPNPFVVIEDMGDDKPGHYEVLFDACVFPRAEVLARTAGSLALRNCFVGTRALLYCSASARVDIMGDSQHIYFQEGHVCRVTYSTQRVVADGDWLAIGPPGLAPSQPVGQATLSALEEAAEATEAFCQPFEIFPGDDVEWQLHVHVQANRTTQVMVQVYQPVFPKSTHGPVALALSQTMENALTILTFKWDAADAVLFRIYQTLCGRVCATRVPGPQHSGSPAFARLERVPVEAPCAYLPHCSLAAVSSWFAVSGSSAVEIRLRDQWGRTTKRMSPDHDIRLRPDMSSTHNLSLLGEEKNYVIGHYTNGWQCVGLVTQDDLTSGPRVCFFVMVWWDWLVGAGVVLAALLPLLLWALWRLRAYWVYKREQRVLRHFPLAPHGAEVGHDLPPSVRVDIEDVEIVKHDLAAGGQGAIALGIFRNTKVVVKTYFLHSATATATFRREVEILVSLRHPNVVLVMGAMMAPYPALVLEFLPHGSLNLVLVRQEELLTWPVRLRIATDCARGLAFLHASGILHLDLKSGNVLLDSDLSAKLTDFGVSRLTSSDNTHTAGFVGSLGWMAPEMMQQLCRPAPACDVYSLSCVLWELATLQTPPFGNLSWGHELCVEVQGGGRPVLPADTPAWLWSVIVDGWAGDPAARPTSEEMLARLSHQVTP